MKRTVMAKLIFVCCSVAIFSNEVLAKKSKKEIAYDEILDQWVGSSVDDLLVTYGIPASSVDMPSGGKLLTYIGIKETEASDLGSKLFGEKGAALDTDSGSQYKCVVNFAISPEGLVKAAKIQHNDGFWTLDPCKTLIKEP